MSLISLRESIDLSSPMGKAVFQILSAIAELERNVISERIRVALASKKIIAQTTKNGWTCGRPTVISNEVIARVQSLREQKVSIRNIAKQLGIAKSTVQRLMVRTDKPLKTS